MHFQVRESTSPGGPGQSPHILSSRTGGDRLEAGRSLLSAAEQQFPISGLQLLAWEQVKKAVIKAASRLQEWLTAMLPELFWHVTLS